MRLDSFSQTKGLKVIGRGAFTRCYDNGDTVLLVSSCPVKECMSCGFWSDSDLFPAIERIDYKDNSQLFKMKKYNKQKSLKQSLLPEEYQKYKMLCDFAKIWYSKTCNIKNQNLRHTEFCKLVQNSELTDELKNALLESADGLANYTSNIGFEISPRNIAVDNGKLILLDVFFSVDHLINTRKGK
jgi:hypothetical protein